MAALQVVGGGRMGEALVGGLLKAGGHSLDSLSIVEPVAARRAELETIFPGVDVTDAPAAAEGTVIAVKPGDVPAACRAVAEAGLRARAVDRRRRHARHPRGAPRRRHPGRAGHAEHARARRARRLGHRGRHRTPATTTSTGPSASSPPSASSSG